MRLELGNIFIKDMQFGNDTKVENGTLYINKEELLQAVSGDERIKSIDFDIVRPGEEVRIIPVKDVVEPRVKVEGKGGIFPGFINKVDTVGSGRTHVLKGAAVVTTGKVVGFQEGIIDMCGEGAKYTPFSKTNNLVAVVEPKDGVHQHEHEEALRMIGFKAATYLGEAGRNVEPDEIKTYETLPLLEQVKQYPDLPKVVYVYMLQTQGLLHDTYVYGVDAKKIIPTFIYPTEVFDGAIVSGNCVSACDKNPSYVHMNQPVITDLYERHGKDFNFLGCIITNENVYLADKERSSNMTAKLVEYLGADAVIISEEGFGNPDADLVMNCNKITDKGIKTVLITDEYAGQDGCSQSLADSTPKADAVVTGGNANEVVTLPPMKKVIGHPEAANIIAGGYVGSLREDGSINAEIQVITGATSEVGFNYLSAKGL
ncbi:MULTISPECIES: glycine/sarcosine/betaine reductase component B subunit [Clostridium]|uniref:Beta-aspartyl-peptidase n=1 Tax=Clostridium cadaveris TaxID=1529 RepID=A0A1I2KDQ1_9CLOT|nr:glycine/sarcosine/betaine reductase component B subunit [Clostridium cadaveris]MDU4952085.1 glycine/sarcosine/betaine reductase component B subunit [Clostridium sp.]MDM8310598.1 glycine/sarcosine/betaine reductase component B subunit [Clostridium cadaveris]NME65149.1 beta-aspartyl-peptidase [Clostridium cadaveris]NWK11393.1 glycine/sarcosine/betaine reductase component B subunit [Clostridium cadaveris]PWL51343.1 MAG: beta-aspartyl-peptidase [Clostridium cadaveris]